VTLGQTTAPKQVTIRNTGDLSLDVTAISLTPTNQMAFQIDQMNAFSIPAGQSSTVNVTFTPQASGATQAMITIEFMSLSPVSVSLHGTGVNPHFGATPAGVDFGTVVIGQTAGPSVITLKNADTVDVTIASIASSNSQFTIDQSKTSMMVKAGQSTTFGINFTPTAAGPPQTATVAISLAGVTRPIATVMATGMGVHPSSAHSGCAVSGTPASATPLFALLAFIAFIGLALRRTSV
jgi:MYXO-CTERM domain-containing protein